MIVRVLAFSWLILVLGFVWGAQTIQNRVFPHAILDQLSGFLAGAEGEATGLFAKLESDSGGAPRRFIHPFDIGAASPDLAPLPIPGLHQRRAAPLVRLSPEAPRGYRILFAAFDFEETLWGAVLLGPDGGIVRQWRLSTDDLPLSREPSHRKNMYGVAILPDGSIIYSMHEDGGGIVRVDWCGERLWALEGVFHHVASPDDRGGFWTFGGRQHDFDHILVRVDIETGEMLERIDMGDVRRANPDIHIFDLQAAHDVTDRVHGNDIDPLPAALADRFPGFAAGDLAISFRVTNLVFVLDPETLKIKWWRVGPWDRQHDADWDADGRISAFSNNERGVGAHSKIVAVDPVTYESEVLLDGADYDFYSEFNGAQQRTPSGGRLVTSSVQGRIFETDPEGRVVFDFVNAFDPEKNEVLHAGDAFFLPSDYFDFSEPPACPQP